MDLRVGDDQRELAEGIRALVAGRLSLAQVRAREGRASVVETADWAALGDAGLFALTLPEPAGTGLGMADAVVVFEELGRALAPGPLVGTFLAARAGVVKGAAEGRALVGVHCAGARAGAGAGAGAGPVLVEHLASLDALLVLSGDGDGDGPAPAGVRARLVAPAPSASDAVALGQPLDPLTPLWRLPSLPAGEPLAEDDPDVAGTLWRDGSLLTAALQVGHAARTLELAVDYAGQRHQFGKPIGSFQAIKHLCADMLVRAEVARAALHAAACLADEPDVAVAEAAATGARPGDVVGRAVTGAKLLADEAAIANARSAIQVHGGMGFTWEVPLHLYLKRARLLSTTFGTAGDLAAALANSA